MNTVAVRTPFNIYLDFDIAPLYRRAAAWGIDISLLAAFSYSGSAALTAFGVEGIGWLLLVLSLPMLLYPLVTELVFEGQSLGKRLLKLRVISLAGEEPGIGQYLMRWIFRVWEWPVVFGAIAYNTVGVIVQLVASCLIGILVLVVIAVSNKGQRLGDLAAGTTVVTLQQRFSLDDTVFRDIVPSNYKVSFGNVMMLSDRDINAIKSVIQQTRRTGRYDNAFRIAEKVKEVLQISNDGDVLDFLETLLRDYNYLATRE